MTTGHSASATGGSDAASSDGSAGDNPDAPLKGLRVIEFGQYIAVPAAGQLLADLGADVVKVESSDGDASRKLGWSSDDCGPMFSAYNGGKRSVVLALNTAAGSQTALTLALSADVLLQNMRPGVMDRLGLGSQRLMGLAPRLVYGQVSGFGQHGPASLRPGLDIAAQAESGMMSLNGDADRDPTRVGFTVVDAMAARTLATGVLAALLRRGVTGRGGRVDVSLIDIAVEALSNAFAEHRLLGRTPSRRGNGQPNAVPAAEVVRTADGMVVVSAYTQDHFARLCRAIGRPELISDERFATNPARVQHRHALMDLLGAAMGGMSSAEACRLLTDASVVVGAIRGLDQVLPGQDGVPADLFVDVSASGRAPVTLPGLSFTMDGVARRARRLPALGEHNAQVLADWGAE